MEAGYRKQVLRVILFVFLFSCFGLYSTFHSMKKTTRLPLESFLAVKTEGTLVYMEVLGLNCSFDYAQILRLFQRVDKAGENGLK